MNFKKEAIKWVLYVSIGAGIALVVHFSGESSKPSTPVAHAMDIEQAPDAVQEKAYCEAWNRNQTHITNNVSNMAIAQHCANYL